MDARILNDLCCPICKGNLLLHTFAQETVQSLSAQVARSNDCDPSLNERVVKEGVLLCGACHTWYPIYSYVPVMLVFSTPFHSEFLEKHSKFALFAEYRMPHGEPKPGEKSVQETFTDEWNRVQNDQLSFVYTVEELEALNEKVWLKWLDGSSERVRSVLNVGCGLGQESLALKRVIKNAEIFAIDLNFALLESGERFKSIPDIHLVMASLFHLPFKPSSFDLVYSQGVLMTTFSTFEAFKVITAYARPGGYVFIWVYGLDDHLRRRGFLGLIARANYRAETIIRPLISRSPKFLRDILFSILTLILHPLVKTRVRHKQVWRLRNTNHGLRDWLSPRYARRHSYNDVLEWFENLGLRVIDVQSPAAYRRLFRRQLWGVGVTGQRPTASPRITDVTESSSVRAASGPA